MDAPNMLPLETLSNRKPTPFAHTLTPDECQQVADTLGLDGLRKASIRGTLAPKGRRDWALQGTIGATVVQPCVVSLTPVTTRIDTDIARQYLAEMPEYSEGSEMEMPEDDTQEPLPEAIDLLGLFSESLALAVPEFPRAEGVDLDQTSFTEPGKTPMTDEDARPFAGLAGLRDQLSKTDGSQGQG